MKRAAAAFSTALFLCTLSAAAREPTPVMHILVFGDSLSEGLFLRHSQAWPALLIPKFRNAGLKAEILNASQSGGTTQDGLDRLDKHLNSKSAGGADSSRGEIDIFILELGINDVFHAQPIGEIRKNLQEIINRVKRASPNVRLIICGMQLPNYSNDDYVGDFGTMFADIAKKNNAALVPYLLEGVAGDPALNLPDRLHPNADGHKILAENVWRILEPIAREVAQSKR